MSHKIRLRPAPQWRREQFSNVHRAAYDAFYRGQNVGLIYTAVSKQHTLWWIVWQDSHGHDAKGRYRRRGDAKRALLRAVVAFRAQHPKIYGAP
jgi:hypothetical protein